MSDTTDRPVLGELSVLQKPNCWVFVRCWPSPSTWESPPKNIRNVTSLTDRICGWRFGLHHGIPSSYESNVQMTTEEKRKARSVFSSPSVAGSAGGHAAPAAPGHRGERVAGGPLPPSSGCSFTRGEDGSTGSCPCTGVAAGSQSPWDTGY